MKHLNYFMSLVTALLLGSMWASAAEVVPNYSVDFNTAISTTSGFKVDAGWDHKTAGSVTYTYSATEGVDGSGALKIGTQALYSWSSWSNDELITPPITGTVTLKVKATASASSNTVIKIWKVTKSNDSWTNGDAVVDETGTGTELGQEDWFTVTVTGLAGERLGIAGSQVIIDDFEVSGSAEIEYYGLTINRVSLAGSTTVYCDADNNFSFTYTVAVTNTGFRDIAVGTTHYSISIVEYSATDVALLTVPLTVPLAVGESTTIEIPVQLAYAQHSARMRYDAREDFGNSTKAGSWIEPVPYEPGLGVKYDGNNIESGFALSFGMGTSLAAKAITVRSTGAAPLAATITAPEGFAVDVAEVNLASGESQDVNISVVGDPGIKSGNLVISGAGIEDFNIALSATLVDPSKLFVDFSDGIPAGFVNEGYWSVASGRLENGTASAWPKFITPLLSFEQGEQMTVDVSRKSTSSSSSYGLKVYYSADRQNWTLLKEIANSELPTTKPSGYGALYDPATIVIDGIPAGEYYIAFAAGYVYIDNIYGGEVVPVAHDLMISSSTLPAKGAINKSYAASATLLNVAASAEGAITAKLYFGNDVVAEKAIESLEAGASVTPDFGFVPTQGFEGKAKIAFVCADDYTIATEEADIVISDKFFEDFENLGSAVVPAGWVRANNNLNKTTDNSGNTYLWSASSTGRAITPLLRVAEGETASVDIASRNSSNCLVKVYYSADRSEWTELGTIAQGADFNSTYSFQTFAISGIPAGDWYLAFDLTYAALDNLDGFELVAVEHDLMVTASSFPALTQVGKTFKASATVLNVGNDEHGYTAKLFLGNEEKASLTPDEIVLNNASTTAELSFETTEPFEGKAHIEFLFGDDYVLSTPEADVVITSKFYENFNDGEIPAGWLNEDNKWTITTETLNGDASNKCANQSNYSKAYQLVTPMLQVAGEDDVMTFKVQREVYSPEFEVLYSTDRQNWTSVYQKSSDDLRSEMSYNTWYDLSISGIPAGNYYIAFAAYGMDLDEVFGFELVDVDHDAAITSSSFPATGMVNKTYTAKATLKNLLPKADGAFDATLYLDGQAVATAQFEGIAAGAEQEAALSFVPNAIGEYELYIEFDFGEDYSVATPVAQVTINEETASSEVVAGNATGTSTQSPLYLNYYNSETESVYTAEQLGMSAGQKIVKLTWRGYKTSDEYDATVNVWLENTTDAAPRSESTGLFATDEMTNVFSGNYTWQKVGSSSELADMLVVEIPEGFVYEGNNLRVVVRSNASSWKNAYFEVDANASNKARGHWNDTQSTFETTNSNLTTTLPLPVLHIGIASQAAQYTGKVVDSDGEPIVGAVVNLKESASAAGNGIKGKVPAGSNSVQYEAITDENGEFTVDVLQADKTYDLTVSASGYKPYTAEGVSFADGNIDAGDIVLETEVTGIKDIDANREVAGVTYYNMAGQQSDKAFDGVNIVVTKYTDGTKKTTKVVF